MSSYFGVAFNPLTKQVEPCEYLDNYYGPHRYAVRFEDGHTIPEEEALRALDEQQKGGE